MPARYPRLRTIYIRIGPTTAAAARGRRGAARARKLGGARPGRCGRI